MVPKKSDELTQVVRQKELRYLMFIKEKIDGTVKARECRQSEYFIHRQECCTGHL